MNRMRRIGIAGLLVCLLLGLGSKASIAQIDNTLWSEPANLSHSGAAEAPVLVAGPEGHYQVFWWDRFDGIMTSFTIGENQWSPSEVAPIQMLAVREGARAEVVTMTVESMPQIVGGDEVAFALWLGEPAEETTARPLLYSRLRIGTAIWSAPELLAESAIDWEVTRDAQGIWHLIYRQPQQLTTAPAGIYYLYSTDGGVSWSAPAAVYTSLYVRLWPEGLPLSVAADGVGNVLVGWNDPRQERAFYTLSTDAGASWRTPDEVRDGEMVGQRVHFVTLPASSRGTERSEILLLWEQTEAAFACTLMQQRSVDGGKTWSAASPVLEELTSCPPQIRPTQTAAGKVFLMLGEGTERLLLVAWNGAHWSKVVPLNFSFENPEIGVMNSLVGLQADVTQDDGLMVVGQGQDGDIWVLQGQVDAAEWVFAPPSPWSNYELVSDNVILADLPTVALDAEGRLHTVWSGLLKANQPETALYYSLWDGSSWSQPTVVLGAAESMARSPAAALVNGILHVVWSGGPMGTVFYSWAYSRDAYAASSWSEPYMLGAIDVGSSPALAVDLLGRLHGVYAVPFNEDRGLYYTRIDNHGEAWVAVVQIFDAAGAHWDSIDHPSVTVDERGTLHVVWVRASLPDYGVPQGIYYAQSIDHGKTWSDARILTDGPYDWPQVVTTLTGQIIVAWQDLTHGVNQYRLSDDYGQTWGYVSQIPGLQAIEGRLTLTEDKVGRVHLTALETETEMGVKLLHLTLTEGQWRPVDPANLERLYLPVGGAVPFVSGEAGVLDVVGTGSLRGADDLILNLWHIRRSIESGTAINPEFAPNPTPTLTPGPTLTPSPTPRPAVDPNPPPSSAPVIALGPLSLPFLAVGGIGLALLLVGSVVAWKVLRH